MDSIWKRTAETPPFAPLDGDLKTDVLIVGGGLAGLLCAYWLNRAGVDCALVEADRLCGGVTGNTTAKLTIQHGLIYDKLLREFGLEKARLYLEANREALGRYRELCRDGGCDFEERDSYVYALSDRRKLERELEALERLGFPAEFVESPALPMPTAGAVRFPKQAQFHPLKFAAAIAKGLRIYEHTKVLELGPGTAATNHGTVTAEKIVIAAHFPLLNKHGGYFLKLYQSRSYVLALENAREAGGMYVDEGEKGLSFRDYKGFLLLGGGGHRTGKRGGGWRELEDFARRHYPQAKIAARWAAQDCMTLDGVPYAGRYAKGTEGLYVAAGFNKWGMTSSMVAARVLADLVQGKENPYVELFSPSHMGCALKYNPQEHSWDCPCHGSRFGEDGRLIDNPATDDKKNLKVTREDVS